MSTDRRSADRRQSQQPVVDDRRTRQRRTGDRRTEVRTPLDLWVEEEKGAELYFRRTGNVSIGGVFFEQTIPHPLGTRVRLRFSLPGHAAPLVTMAEVVNTPSSRGAPGVGLRFLDLGDAARAALQAFLDSDD